MRLGECDNSHDLTWMVKSFYRISRGRQEGGCYHDGKYDDFTRRLIVGLAIFLAKFCHKSIAVGVRFFYRMQKAPK